MTMKQVLSEAMALPPEERRAVAEELLQSLSNSDRETIDAAWLAEARHRDEALARGEINKSPVEEAIGRVVSRARQ